MTTCPHCNESITAHDHVRFIHDGSAGVERAFHVECVLRAIIGSVGHQQRLCSCYGRVDTSEVGLSKRQAAQRAYSFFRVHNTLQQNPN